MQRGVLAWVGPHEATPRIAEAAQVHGLHATGDLPGLSLFAGHGLALVSSDGKICVGDIFGPVGATSARWGNFLTFTAGLRGLLEVERAPLTGMPLYWAPVGDGTLLFSHLELGTAAGLSLAPDWNFVAHSLAYRNRRSARTGIAGVSELLPGTRLRCADADHYVDLRWSPWTFAATTHEPCSVEAAEHLRDMAIACTGQWGRGRGGILLELSGGLDSSIIAVALSAAGVSFEAVTVATVSADGDERRFARDVAAASSVRLAEALHDDTDIDLAKPPALLTPRPAAQNILRGFDRAIARAASGADASLWSGIGGDNIFHYSNSVAPALDVLQRHGAGMQLARTIGDIARVTGTHWWHVARHVWRRGRRPRNACLWPRDEDFAAAAALPEEPFAHPWDMGRASALPGARQHVEALLRISDFLDRPERWHDRDIVTPLLSQPLVELCLAMPSRLWVEGGRDRALARRAFGADLPPSVATRRTKGRLQTMCASAFRRDRNLLRPLLLEGRLAAADLLDRRAIEEHLARPGVDEDFAYFRLMELADLELWVRSIEAAR